MDLSGISRIRGPLRYVGYLGVLIMMGGLAIFAFGLLSVFLNVANGQAHKGFPSYAIYGFGVAAVGGIFATIALAMGKKESEYDIQIGPRFGDHASFTGSPIYTAANGGTIYAPTQILINQQWTDVEQIEQAVRSLPRAAQGGARRLLSVKLATQWKHETPMQSRARLGG